MVNYSTSEENYIKTIFHLQQHSDTVTTNALAKELKYDGDMKDSAKMNMWLHKQVVAKVAANGGVVPADLKD